MPAPPKTLDRTVAELVAQLDRKIASAQARVHEAQAELASLEKDREALTTALDTIQHGPQPRAEAGDRSWPKLNRGDAVMRVLEVEGRSLSPREISLALSAQGRSGDRPGDVSAALNYLAKTGRASRSGPGLWQAGPPELSGPGLTPAIDRPAGEPGQTGGPAPDHVSALERVPLQVGAQNAKGGTEMGTTSDAPASNDQISEPAPDDDGQSEERFARAHRPKRPQ